MGTPFNIPARAEKNAVQRVFDTIPNEEIISVLIESGDQRAIQLAERMTDPRTEKKSLALMCFEVKLQPKDVWKMIIDNRNLEARLRLSGRLGEIVEAVADAALPQPIPCQKCEGTGEVKGRGADDPAVRCPNCKGQGEVLKPPDRESQKMALEMSEMLNVKVPLIAQQFNTNIKGQNIDLGAPDMTDFSRSTDAIFEEHAKYTAPEVLEAEIVPKTEE